MISKNRRIMSEKPRVTLADIAHTIGVTKMTVSNVINNRPGVSQATRLRVLEAIAETEYVVNVAARGLAGGRTNLIGMVVPRLGWPFVSEVVTGASSVAEAAGFDVAVFSTSDDREREKERVSLLRTLADGVLLVLPHTNEKQLGMLERSGVPVVTVATFGTYRVWADSYHGAVLATEHLLDLGHRRIAHIAGPEHLTVGREDVLERIKGYQDTLERAGIPFDPNLLVQGEFTRAGGYSATQHLMQRQNPPSAIFASNDQSAFGALEAARELNIRVPEDLSIIGFDDIPAATVTHPPLTTIRQPLQEIGERAMRMLLELMNHQNVLSREILLPTSLVVRQSTTPYISVKNVPNIKSNNFK
jgi:LacI family transcriptional regulator